MNVREAELVNNNEIIHSFSQIYEGV